MGAATAAVVSRDITVFFIGAPAESKNGVHQTSYFGCFERDVLLIFYRNNNQTNSRAKFGANEDDMSSLEHQTECEHYTA